MNFKAVTSRENPVIKAVFKLKSSAKERKNQGKFIVEGLRVCSDCIENGVQFDTLILTEKFVEKNTEIAEDLAVYAENTIVVPEFVFEKIADTETPQGVLAVVKMPENSLEINKNGRYIALENLQDPSNLGAVSRTAEALGIDGIIISSNSCDPYSPKVVRASMGTILRVPIIISKDFLGELKGSGLKLYACVVKDGKKITDVTFSDGTVVLIGNEANGLTENTVAACEKITIPMSGRAESLNASVAAAIAMWELKR